MKGITVKHQNTFLSLVIVGEVRMVCLRPTTAHIQTPRYSHGILTFVSLSKISSNVIFTAITINRREVISKRLDLKASQQ